jgi:hypothetical protein
MRRCLNLVGGSIFDELPTVGCDFGSRAIRGLFFGVSLKGTGRGDRKA